MEEFVILHQTFNRKNIAFKFKLPLVMRTSPLPFFNSTDYEFVICCQIKQVILNDTGRYKEYTMGCLSNQNWLTKSAFLWGNQEHWSDKIFLDHGASKELMHPFWLLIYRFLWCNMIQTDLGSLILIQMTPKKAA